jgi:hypothetical protein
MPAFVWIALGVFGLCLLAGGIWAAVNALRAWRRGLPAYRRLTAASASMSGRSTELERRLATLEPKTSQLQRDVARLQRSVSRAGVLLGSVQEARTALRLARLFVR